MQIADRTAQPRYRWIVAGAAAIILAVAMGSIVNGASAFILPLQAEYGWSRADASLINFSGIVGLAFGGIFMGRLADRRGVRPVVLFGSVVLGLGYVAAGFASAPWHYYSLLFIAGFFGAGAIFAPVMAAVGGWFVTGAGLAIGIASAGQALGQGGVPFASAFLIELFGIGGAFTVTGLVMLATLVPLALLLRPAPELNEEARVARAVRDAGLLSPREVSIWMSAAIILCCTCMSIPLMHLAPLIQDRAFDGRDAGAVVFAMMISGVFGRLVFGALSDRIGAIPAYMCATCWMGLLVYGFTLIDDLEVFYVYAVVYGFGYAGVMTGVLATTRALTPASHLAMVMGIVGLFGWLGHANGGFLGGFLFDVTGGHEAAYGVAAAAALLNLVVVGLLFRRTQGPSGAPAPA